MVLLILPRRNFAFASPSRRVAPPHPMSVPLDLFHSVVGEYTNNSQLYSYSCPFISFNHPRIIASSIRIRTSHRASEKKQLSSIFAASHLYVAVIRTRENLTFVETCPHLRHAANFCKSSSSIETTLSNYV